jgi:hypothetical protein
MGLPNWQTLRPKRRLCNFLRFTIDPAHKYYYAA